MPGLGIPETNPFAAGCRPDALPGRAILVWGPRALPLPVVVVGFFNPVRGLV